MIEPVLPAKTAVALGQFLVQWMRGLWRASEERKANCLLAIEAAVIATRKTQAYCRARDAGNADPKTEEQLAMMWTDLGFQLDRLKVTKLAKRCNVKGRYWANPDAFSKEWLEQADIGLDSVERIALQLMAQIKANGAPR